MSRNEKPWLALCAKKPNTASTRMDRSLRMAGNAQPRGAVDLIDLKVL
jgi:hypothetical protein